MDPAKMSSDQTHNLQEELDSLQFTNFQTDSQRAQVRESLLVALSRVESPWDTALRIVYTVPALGASLKVCYDVKLFRKWVKAYNDDHVTSEQLSQLVLVDHKLLVRSLRHLAATHVIEQVSVDTYSLTPFSRALGLELESMIPFMYNTSLPGFSNLPEYLWSNGYVNPTDASATNWHHMRGISRFDELKQKPADMAIFQDVMAARSAASTTWTELYPPENLLSASKPDAVLLVDVGGGAGHDIEHLRKALPDDYDGELVLQDQGSAVHNAPARKGVKAMEHDFFKEQPIKGATAYYLHTVLHDWPDDRAVKILSNLANACEPGYSRVLIHETVVAEKPSVQVTTLDLQMMMVLSSFERTEVQWRAIVAAAGLEVVRTWSIAGGAESIIELIKK